MSHLAWFLALIWLGKNDKVHDQTVTAKNRLNPKQKYMQQLIMSVWKQSNLKILNHPHLFLYFGVKYACPFPIRNGYHQNFWLI